MLAERNFPIKSLQAAGQRPQRRQDGRVHGQDVHGRGADARTRFKDVQIAFFSAGGSISKEFAPAAVTAGAVVVDNTSAFRMKDGIPLVVPEVNPEQIHKHNGLIANPNCSTIIMNVPVWPLHKVNRVKRMIVSTYQAVSGAGAWGLYELDAQMKAYAAGRADREGEVPAPDRQQPLQPQHQDRRERLQRGREQDGATRRARSSATRRSWSPPPASACPIPRAHCEIDQPRVRAADDAAAGPRDPRAKRPA